MLVTSQALKKVRKITAEKVSLQINAENSLGQCRCDVAQ